MEAESQKTIGVRMTTSKKFGRFISAGCMIIVAITLAIWWDKTLYYALDRLFPVEL